MFKGSNPFLFVHGDAWKNINNQSIRGLNHAKQCRKVEKTMKKEDLMKIDGMTEELATKIAEASAEELKGYIPKSRFDEVNEAKKNAEALVKERDKQLEDVKKSTGDNEELKKQIETLQEQNKVAKAQYEADIKKMAKDSIDAQLMTENGAKNAKAVLALLDAVDGKLEGDEYKAARLAQIQALQKSDSYLFNIQNDPQVTISGATPASGNTTPPGGGKKPEEMTYEDFCNQETK